MMEHLKDPQMVLSLVNSGAIIGSFVYLNNKINTAAENAAKAVLKIGENQVAIQAIPQQMSRLAGLEEELRSLSSLVLRLQSELREGKKENNKMKKLLSEKGLLPEKRKSKKNKDTSSDEEEGDDVARALKELQGDEDDKSSRDKRRNGK